MIRTAVNAGIRSLVKVVRTQQSHYEFLNMWATQGDDERPANA